MGTFDTPKEAAIAHDRVAIQERRPISKLNFLDQVPTNYKPKKKKLRSNNTTGFRGVYKRGNRYQANIYFGGKQQNIGTFGTAKEAAEAYDQAAIQAKRSRCELNFPDMIHTSKKEEEEEEEEEDEDEEDNGDSDEGEEERPNVKYKGISKSGNRFMTKIVINGKQKYLGTFDTAKEAAEAHDYARIQAGHPISTLNFLDQEPKNYNPKKKKLKSNNTTGFRGVYQTGNRFQASIWIGGRLQNVGRFGTAKEAALGYDRAAIQAKFPRSELNFFDAEKEELPTNIKKKIKKKKIRDDKNKISCCRVQKFNIRRKFKTRIYFDGKKKHFGSFTRARDAAMAYNAAILKR